jgi:phosphopantetheinyl transferase (holo-ACP synthase)
LGIERPASVPFRDVEVLGKPPKLVARGVAAELLAKLGVDRVHVSISHTRDYAAAVVVLERSY